MYIYIYIYIYIWSLRNAMDCHATARVQLPVGTVYLSSFTPFKKGAVSK